MREIPVDKVYGYFEQGSTILVITHDGKRPNLATISYHMMLDESGIIVVGMGAWDHSYHTLLKTKECVIAIPTLPLLETTVKVGNCSGESTDKFKTFGLNALPSGSVKPPLLSEALINVECVLVEDDITERYNAVILKIQNAWLNDKIADRRLFHHNGNGIFTIDGEKKDLGELMTMWPEHVANRD
jgi:flavin reductase (DIM6/NTAB) family NADH-FMN oxidoreductase RutF